MVEPACLLFAKRRGHVIDSNRLILLSLTQPRMVAHG